MNESFPFLCGVVLLAILLASGGPAQAQTDVGPEPAHVQLARELVTQAAQSAARGAMRVEVTLGSADPRLRLAPCRRAEPYLPAGHKPYGRTRVGLRCVDGATPWNITLPVQVAVFAPGVTAREALPAGTRLLEAHLQLSEIDWGAHAERAFPDAAPLLGRELARPLVAGTPVLASHLRQRQWFSAGETVQVHARGSGFVVTTDGEALSPGVEGQPVKVRTAAGRILSGRAVGDRRVEVML